MTRFVKKKKKKFFFNTSSKFRSDFTGQDSQMSSRRSKHDAGFILQIIAKAGC